MFFFLRAKLRDFSNVKINLIGNFANPSLLENDVLYLQAEKQRLETLETSAGKLLILGDPIFQRDQLDPEMLLKSPKKINGTALYREIKGHYYWFLLHREGLSMGTSFGSVFPIYYKVGKEAVTIGSSSFFLAQEGSAPSMNKQNVLERLLFNYPFFDSTWWQEIKLLAAHHSISPSENRLQIEPVFDISHHFQMTEDRPKQQLQELADLFQEETELFFPDSPFAVSLTGGFDGRTVMAAARKAGRSFQVYCHGKTGSSDLVFSEKIAAKLQIPHFPVRLDDSYVENESLLSAWSFMKLTEYNGNFGRPHYDFATRLLSQQVPYILTGNFGSELFRALHNPGVMISDCLIRVFSATDSSWKDYLTKAAQSWAGHFFDRETEALIADLENYLEKMAGWDANARFYYFVYNEVFRKYFGPEIVMQSHYFNNRTPFLNFRFVQALNQTRWSGLHSQLFEKDLRKRWKGQIFYATFLRKADQQLYHLKTNKGYSPAEVLETWRLPFLLKGVVTQKYLAPKENDDHSVEAFFINHQKALYDQIVSAQSEDFIASRMSRSREDVFNRKNLSSWIKFYSIAAGWESSKALCPVTT